MQKSVTLGLNNDEWFLNIIILDIVLEENPF